MYNQTTGPLAKSGYIHLKFRVDNGGVPNTAHLQTSGSFKIANPQIGYNANDEVVLILEGEDLVGRHLVELIDFTRVPENFNPDAITIYRTASLAGFTLTSISTNSNSFFFRGAGYRAKKPFKYIGTFNRK